MPTNKLWLEHTERAAWESVQALREKLADAEKRIQRIMPKGGSWQAAFDALDGAKQEHGLPGTGYAELVHNLIDKLNEAEASVRTLTRETERLRDASKLQWQAVTENPKSVDRRSALDDDDDDFEDRPSSSARFFTEVRKRHRARVRQSGRGEIDQLLSSIETQVDDLSELDEAELPDALVELAALALCLDEEVRHVRHRGTRDNEPES